MGQLVLAGRVILYLLRKEVFILSVILLELEMCPNYMEVLILQQNRQKFAWYGKQKFWQAYENSSNILFAFTGHLPIYFLAFWMKDMFAGH